MAANDHVFSSYARTLVGGVLLILTLFCDPAMARRCYGESTHGNQPGGTYTLRLKAKKDVACTYSFYNAAYKYLRVRILERPPGARILTTLTGNGAAMAYRIPQVGMFTIRVEITRSDGIFNYVFAVDVVPDEFQ